ncbi:hypothetical protein ElyMa_002550000 [Elysia marginata]|uniref:Sushi domain-containing protein n=1 Tax=Elysia marginata TaxID=1093978 RepID=A0AAV4GV19_9GAST|nr:hypothetical protein ElyMa_002550000 [Elysia marginata]
MADNTLRLVHRLCLTKSIQTVLLWTLLSLACHLVPPTFAQTQREQTTYKPIQNHQMFYTRAREDHGHKEIFWPTTQPQHSISRQREFLKAQRKSPVPFRASVPYMAQRTDRFSSVSSARRADQGPGVATLYRTQRPAILEEDIDVIASESGSPPTETVPLYECPSSYRATPDGDGTTFQIFDSGRWWTHNCQTGLVWDQTLCRCEYPPDTRWELDCSRVKRCWNLDLVISIRLTLSLNPATSPCDIMLNMTFDHGVEDTAKGSFVEVGQGLPLPTRSDPEQGPRRGGNRAAYFTDTALNIWYFSDNDMGSSLRLEFRFLQDVVARSPGYGGSPVDTSNYQMFLSNGCNISTPGYMPPSVAIGYRASDHSYLLAFETNAVRKAIVCSRPTAPGRWHSVSLLYEDGTLVMRVDGQPCVVSADFSGPIQKSPCPLTIGADPLDRQGVYRGYLDDLLIARNCRDPSENSAEDVQLEQEELQDPVPYRAKLLGDIDRAEQYSLTKNHLDKEQHRYEIDLENETKPTHPDMDHLYLNTSKIEDAPMSHENYSEYVAPRRYLYSENVTRFIKDVEIEENDDDLVSIKFTTRPVSKDLDMASTSLESNNVRMDTNRFVDNETKIYANARASESLNSSVFPTTTETSAITTESTNNTNTSQTDDVTSKTTEKNSLPQPSLFRAAVGGKANRLESLDNAYEHKSVGLGFSGLKKPESFHEDYTLNNDNEIDGYGGMSDGLADHEDENHDLLISQNVADELDTSWPGEYQLDIHNLGVDNGFPGRKRLGVRDNISVKFENQKMVTGDLTRVISTNESLTRRNKVGEEFDIQLREDDMNEHLATPSNAYVESENRAILDDGSTGGKNLGGHLVSKDQDFASHEGADDHVEEIQLDEKAHKFRKPHRYFHQMRLRKSNKTIPQVYSSTSIKYRPPRERMWYESVHKTQPLVPYNDKPGRQWYSYTTIDASMHYPNLNRSPSYSKERFSRGSNRRYDANQKSLKDQNRRDRRRRVPVIVMKRWYD